MRFICAIAMSVVAVCVSAVGGQTPSTPRPDSSPALDRYLGSVGDRAPSYRAKRVLTARAGSRQATLVAMTTRDAKGDFAYEILSEDGSGIIRSKVLRAALEAEQNARKQDQAARAAVTPANYTFETSGSAADGVERVIIKPRRDDAMMIDGAILLNADDGDLLKIQGLLVKRPSFWTRRVEIERQYARIAGARVPVSMSSVADVLFVGRSTFDMRYEYETIDGVLVAESARK
jgi:hypothetical protein